ncbi:hypothetical protein [Nitrosomonas europaea]|nr:hypothetical protein [Nitrosomonas europaea]
MPPTQIEWFCRIIAIIGNTCDSTANRAICEGCIQIITLKTQTRYG